MIHNHNNCPLFPRKIHGERLLSLDAKPDTLTFTQPRPLYNSNGVSSWESSFTNRASPL